MKDQIMTRFVALTAEPENPPGVATYTYCGRVWREKGGG